MDLDDDLDSGACILTPENIGTEDDCTTHDHEVADTGMDLSQDDVDRILDWFVEAWRDKQGPCGPENDDLVRRLQTHFRNLNRRTN